MENIIELEDVCFSYKNFKISKVSFNIREGEKLALIGANGSGKTTILRLIVNLLKRTHGNINVLGIQVNNKNEWEIRKQIGFLFQNPDDQLFAPTVWEDVAFGPRNLKLSKEKVNNRVEWALKSVKMLKFKNESPSNLSWGQKKLVALAGILAMKPKILFLDEPFANLDMFSVKELLEILETLRISENLTVLFTTHNHFFIQYWADRMVVLKLGKVIFVGDPNIGLNQSEIKDAIGTWDSVFHIIHPKEDIHQHPHIHIHSHPHPHNKNNSHELHQHSNNIDSDPDSDLNI
ncbi:MAG: energy-coupling factor ABC transporter ATP-binding protein [Candidatus Helarchaeota archaeon]